MQFMIFNTESNAQIAIQEIDQTMCMPIDDKTLTWANPEKTKDNNWVFKKPDDPILSNVSVSYSLEEFNPNWFDAGL